MMPSIKTFHARVGVRGEDGLVNVIKADLPDFATSYEVLTELARSLDVKTAGDIVKKLNCGVRSFASISDAAIAGAVADSDIDVYDWKFSV